MTFQITTNFRPSSDPVRAQNFNPAFVFLFRRCKSILSLLLFLSLLGAAAAQRYPSVSTAGVLYRCSVPSSIQAQVAQWVGTHPDLVVGCAFDLSAYYPTGLTSATYVDSLWTANEIGAYVQDCVPSGGNYESVLLHQNRDVAFTANSQTGWAFRDQFDAFEPALSSLGYEESTHSVNGVLLFDGSSYTDITQKVYGDALTRAQNTIIFGATAKFNGFSVILDVPQSGNVVTWRYWNGQIWKNLTLSSDTTASFTRGGGISFAMPSDWVPTNAGGNGVTTGSKYLLQAVITGSGTYPTFSRMITAVWNQSNFAAISYNPTANYYQPMSLMSAPAVSMTSSLNTLYIGYMEPFDVINIALSTVRSGGSTSYEYWNGSAWTRLTGTSHWGDTGGGLAHSGKVTFYPPTNWARTTLSGPGIANGGTTRPKFWVRAVVTGATTYPGIDNISGDDWVSFNYNGTAGARGWLASDTHIITVANGYQYNPTPATTSSARFAYQARTTGYGNNPNRIWPNPTTYYGTNLYATVKACQVANTSPPTANGVMFDNAGSGPMKQLPSWAVTQTDACASCTQTYPQMWNTAYSVLNSTLRANYGSTFAVTANVTTDATNIFPYLFGTFDVAWAEGVFYAYSAGDFAPATDSFYYWDQALPNNNPAGTKIAIIAYDQPFYGGAPDRSGNYHVWDRSNRGPMEALATHYMGANPNTIFSYSVSKAYNATDEVYLWNTAPNLVLSAALAANQGSSPKTIRVVNGSAIANPGGVIGYDVIRICPGPTTSGCEQGDILQVTGSGTTWSTVNPIVRSYPAGALVEYASYVHMGTLGGSYPDWHNVYFWSTFFPAMAVDIGVPDQPGWNGGARDLAYRTPLGVTGSDTSQIGSSSNACSSDTVCDELWRRDYTKAIVLVRAHHSRSIGSEWDTYGPPIDLTTLGANCAPNCQYALLYADGTTGPVIGAGTPQTTISLRGGESAILMKQY